MQNWHLKEPNRRQKQFITFSMTQSLRDCLWEHFVQRTKYEYVNQHENIRQDNAKQDMYTKPKLILHIGSASQSVLCLIGCNSTLLTNVPFKTECTANKATRGNHYPPQVQKGLDSYVQESHGCSIASLAVGRLSGLTSTKLLTKSINPTSDTCR